MASFEGIKVGDEVVIQPPSRYWPRYVATVLRVTPTQFKVSRYTFRKKEVSRYTFRKKDGRCIGDYGARVYQATPELLAEVSAEQRFISAHENLVKLRNQLETVTREIDRTHDKHQLAETMEAAAADVAAGIAKLREAMP